jgi:hypothetical protein
MTAMGFLDDICAKLAAEPVEPRQLDLALPATPQPKVIPPEAPPPRHYRICDRMLPPSFFYGTVEGPIGADGKFLRETILDADAPPVGTVMRFKWHTFPGDRNASGSIVVAAELEASEAWKRHLSEVAYEDQRWRDLVDRATKENASRDFNISLGIPVRWQPAQKLALNAIYEGNGSGARSNSVEHVQVLEPLTTGRIKRRAGDLLCGAKAGSQGLSTEWSPPDDRTPIFKMTCSACLKIAVRFRCEA